jgi:hypothetical protein
VILDPVVNPLNFPYLGDLVIEQASLPQLAAPSTCWTTSSAKGSAGSCTGADPSAIRAHDKHRMRIEMPLPNVYPKFLNDFGQDR